MTVTTSPAVILLLLSVCVFVTTDGRTSDETVNVSKCCKLSEHLAKDELKCRPGTVTNWTGNYVTFKNKINAGIPSTWTVVEDSRPRCKNYTSYKHRVRGSFVAFENGSLYISELGFSVDSASYCLDFDVILVCHEESEFLVQAGTKINRCCGDNAVYSSARRSCINHEDKAIRVPNDTVLITRFPNCNNYVVYAEYSDATVTSNGSLEIEKTNVVLPQDGYCLEYIYEHDDDNARVFACPEFIHTSPSVTKQEQDIRFTIYPIALALSVVFLAATLIAGTLLPASHHVLHWRCQTNHVVCLLIGDTLLCITQLSGISSEGIPCTSVAVAMHFLFLSAFFWLNTMCFNIWWTFRDLRPQNLERSQERCRLRLYEVYAWGFPLVIAGIAATLDLLPAEYNVLRPGFGKDKCWFHGNTEILAYFFGPIGILLVINLTLFVATARELTCGLWKREFVKSTTERAALGRVCVKLVVVMGVSWIADIVSWLAGGPHVLWYFTDIINGLQGVFIFVVVGCQPQVLTAVKRYWCWRGSNAPETAGTTNHHSSSSQGLPSMGDTVYNHSITNNTTKSAAFETSC